MICIIFVYITDFVLLYWPFDSYCNELESSAELWKSTDFYCAFIALF